MATAASVAAALAAKNSVNMQIIEAAAGNARRQWLKNRVEEAALPGSRTWVLGCDFNQGGPWAGIKDLFAGLLPEIQEKNAALLEQHALELIYVLPHLRRSLPLRNPTLTDLSPREERIRNYAPDRAFRIVHGLIDLLDRWKTGSGEEAPWIIACDSYNQSGAMAARFFRELMRRRAEPLKIRLLLAVDPGSAASVRASFPAGLTAEITMVNLPAGLPAPVSRETAEQLAVELEQRIGDDLIEKQIALPELIRLWHLAGRNDRVLQYRCFALEIYNAQGLYGDAFRYGQGLVEMSGECARENKELRWRSMILLLHCYAAMQQAQAGLELAEGEAARWVEQERPLWRAQLCHWTAIYYARYAKPRDLAKAETYLNRSLAWIEQDGLLSPGDLHFNFVFNQNGLALVRNFQGRYAEAIELCRSGITQLNTYLHPEKHRLQRSVLTYNIAQVYVALGAHEEAIRYYTEAMEMDPNYSEYYNERGNVFLRLGRLEEARSDYLKAIELSPPYFEVFTNLGQCCRGMGRMEAAIEAYSRALDLEPGQVLALLGRAKANEELGQAQQAMADYTAALARDGKPWEALASRGVLHYEAGNLPAALEDFDRAIALNPGDGDLRENRAMVVAELGGLPKLGGLP